MKMSRVVSGLALAASVVSAPIALAASHDSALNACKAATLGVVGDAEVRLSSINRSGKIYDFWLDVLVAGSDDPRRMSAYCKVRGSNVLDLVTAEGSWSKSAKRDVAKQASKRLAKN